MQFFRRQKQPDASGLTDRERSSRAWSRDARVPGLIASPRYRGFAVALLLGLSSVGAALFGLAPPTAVLLGVAAVGALLGALAQTCGKNLTVHPAPVGEIATSGDDEPSQLIDLQLTAPVWHQSEILGREAIEADVEAIGTYLTGRQVLVTGAGGSIGSELCAQIARFAPSELVLLDRDESALHSLCLSLEGRALFDDRNVVVADIRDAARVSEVFAEHQPDIVFHAAALKHLPLLEMYPEEAWKTNVEGTNNVLRAAAAVGVRRFVNVSSDKAADPTSVLGYTKRLAEQLTAWYANRTSGDWVNVRFGNVLGSRGSVVETFVSQIEAGGPITVTDPEVTRFFMTASEACHLVIQAATAGNRGEALVLDMGEPVRILDVAKRLAAHSPIPIEIEFTGLRPGEKLHEALVSEAELDIRRIHPRISHVPVPAMKPSQLGLVDQSSPESLKASLASLCEDEFDLSSITL